MARIAAASAAIDRPYMLRGCRHGAAGSQVLANEATCVGLATLDLSCCLSMRCSPCAGLAAYAEAQISTSQQRGAGVGVEDEPSGRGDGQSTAICGPVQSGRGGRERARPQSTRRTAREVVHTQDHEIFIIVALEDSDAMARSRHCSYAAAVQ